MTLQNRPLPSVVTNLTPAYVKYKRTQLKTTLNFRCLTELKGLCGKTSICAAFEIKSVHTLQGFI